MSQKDLKIVAAPTAKAAPDTEPANADPSAAPPQRRRLRSILLIAVPLFALLAGGAIYLAGGRYISTDNAYVGAQKVLITPDISGKIVDVRVREGQHVEPGDELLTLDAVPFQLALDQARAQLDTARGEYETLKTNLKSYNDLTELAARNVELKQRDVERKNSLVKSNAGSQADVDNAAGQLVTAQLQQQINARQLGTTLNQLLNDPDLPLDKFPSYARAKAALDQAQRNLDHTTLRAPISGTATQVDNIQLGRFVAAGGPLMSVVDDQAPWVEANPKETDITHLRLGQKVTLDVDSFPDRTFNGTVTAVSPGTGAQFSILPAQNATGNWVKVVQRVPVRIAFDKGQDTRLLRSGMSVNVAIDTGHSRLPFGTAAASTP